MGLGPRLSRQARAEAQTRLQPQRCPREASAQRTVDGASPDGPRPRMRALAMRPPQRQDNRRVRPKPAVRRLPGSCNAAFAFPPSSRPDNRGFGRIGAACAVLERFVRNQHDRYGLCHCRGRGIGRRQGHKDASRKPSKLSSQERDGAAHCVRKARDASAFQMVFFASRRVGVSLPNVSFGVPLSHMGDEPAPECS